MSPDAKAAALGKVWDHLRVVNSILRTIDNDDPTAGLMTKGLPLNRNTDAPSLIYAGQMIENRVFELYSWALRVCPPTRHMEDL